MSLYNDSTGAFGGYASMEAGQLPNDALSALQVNLRRWEVNNFGYQPSYIHALGVGEEVGELLEAITPEDHVDAIGDIVVYAAQLCSDYRLDIGVLLVGAHMLSPINAHIAVGRINHTVLKEKQGIRGYEDVEKVRHEICASVLRLLGALKHVCEDIYVDLQTSYVTTAEKVMQRNWKKNVITGAE